MTQTAKAKRSRSSARQRIVTAAKSQFAATGFDGASTRQIADSAGVAQSLLLYHFNSKDAIWRAVMDAIFEDAAQLATSEPDVEGLPAEQQLMIGIEAFVDLCAKDPDLHRLMTLEGRSKSDRLTWLVDTHLRRFFEPARELILAGQKTGEIRMGDPTMLYYSIIAIAGSMYSFQPEMALLDPNNKAQDRDQVVQLIRSFLLVET